jgi:hypothetical protein
MISSDCSFKISELEKSGKLVAVLLLRELLLAELIGLIFFIFLIYFCCINRIADSCGEMNNMHEFDLDYTKQKFQIDVLKVLIESITLFNKCVN